MKWTGIRFLATAVCGVLLLLPLGCTIAADALNPAFFSGLGFDPNVFFPPAGVIIVSFTNNTTSPVQFFAYESAEALDPTVDSRNFSVEVEAGERLNEVLDCPIGLVCPGSLAADFSRENLAALVLSTGDEVNYEGVVLTHGQEFTCGDIIDIQLDPPATAGGNYLFTVRVVPGR